VSAVSILAATCAGALVSAPAAQADTPTVFSYTGAEQAYPVPAGVTSVNVVAVGGRGGPGASSGGYGASVSTVIPVTPGAVLYVEVGGNGDDSGGAAFNGGGHGGHGGQGIGGGGGGASDVQSLSGSDTVALGSLLVVAGGGAGGGGLGQGTVGGAAGSAGSSLGAAAGIAPGQPGTTSAGGGGGSGAFGGSDGADGQVGVGGDGGSAAGGSGGGGGGGGYYGGGGGGAGGGVPVGLGNGYGAGGGGGSSFIESAAATPQIGVDSTGTPSVTIEPAAMPPASGAPVLSLISSQNPAPAGTAVTFNATLTPAPTCGSISWQLDSQAPATSAVASASNGAFTLGPVSGLAIGSHSVAFAYSGCATFEATSGSLVETISSGAGAPPTISAKVTSAQPKRNGWYRNPVYVTFACTPGSAPLNTTCPAPVTFSKSEGGQSVTATIGDSVGRTASVKVTVNIDEVAPKLRVTGAVNGATYRRNRHLECRASDILSGVDSCVIHSRRSVHRTVTTVRWTAKAVDVAGNVTTRTGHYRVDPR
jgi:hypothetical protein